MAIRNIRKDGDEVLRKISKEVDAINEKIITLLDDMADTMYKADGVGLAAPQVGILKRVVIVDAGDGLIEIINPILISKDGEQIYMEGCLSVPGVYGEVTRPREVVVEGLNRKGQKIRVEGNQLLAVALCHELDHLEGILFKDKAAELLTSEEVDKKRSKKK